MKHLFFALCIIFFAVTAQATPFLVSDPQSGVTSYQFTGDSFFATKTAEADGSLRYDLAGIPIGNHNINVTACNLWGCSSITPFGFSATIPAVPSNLRLVP